MKLISAFCIKQQNQVQVHLKFLDRNPDLKEGDILWQDENKIIIVEIKPCECIVIKPDAILEAAALSMKLVTGTCRFFTRKMNCLLHMMRHYTICYRLKVISD